MFNFQDWVSTFQEFYAINGIPYNDSALNYGVGILPSMTKWKVIGIHHLSPEENQGKHNVYIEVLCKQNDRELFKAVHWTWEGRQSHEAAPDVFAGQKPLNELVNIPLNLGMVVSVWPHLGEAVANLSSNHPDEPRVNGKLWNSVGHHSFFICFQEIDGDIPIPPPDPEPTPNVSHSIMTTANLSWLNTLPIDDDGNVTF